MSQQNPNLNEDGKPRLSFYDRGPGPAGYKLPTLIGKYRHAPTHRINPAYPMGRKLASSFLTNGIGPGPGAYDIPTGLKANGRFIGYLQTFKMKYPLIDKNSDKPGPTAYRIVKPDVFRPKAPAFKFGSRTPLYNKKVSPGPNTYLLPPALGPKIPDKLAAAECTLKGDRKNKDLPMSPGPIYNIGKPELVKPKTPAFTMRIKWPDLTQQKYEASPASYEGVLPKCPCKVPVGWHLGIRYNEFTGVFRTQCDNFHF